ncbi:dihydroxyacetone kinase family protein [Frigoribacterium faeni]|uniref:Dihydroxyacetone kinase n=1 Tax=Frigoribacterium faeni TaxID=145483 RepID=A0A7W3JFL1_9MICO|nr:dihydroxyacetone kinase family protein [Frigoribacterium faeni]MBA8811967.1 dihydroxyacetone kinase [Frigoribacterium faeni]BFF12965.1 dihydroxyacetone kinase family protein [Microbacterium flavescens]GEK83816.1 erythrulose kinase [Frigoribacterium faeni]
MTRLFNEPSEFADEMIDGFVAANQRWVRRVHGGVVRATRSTPGRVALVVGGGSGHYPAFGGLVGQGLAHGAALGNLFASPSWQQVRSVARSAHSGGGVLLSYGNYAGDVLNFDQAQAKLVAEGIETRTVTVTDDISSASVAEKHKRRGIAGDLTVFKTAAAASDAGYPLDEVVRVAEKANERTRSFGVAFSGCSLPGSDEPLFTVPEGRMAVGMGIHGEPGIGETDVPTANELAELFVASLLAELPDGVEEARGQRVAVLLNGLGSVKYEELFVVYAKVDQLLREAGLTVVEPEVGELVTSFDMAGASLTLFWLDDELEGFWAAPADAPAFKKGAVDAAERLDDTVLEALVAESIPPASPESQEAARTVFAALEAVKTTVDENVDELGRIDAVAGDGDHGIGMQRGVNAAVAAALDALQGGAGAGTLLDRAGDAWSDRAGGTSGALWGSALASLGSALTDDAAPSRRSVAAGVAAATDAILEFGATVGDKTMVDVLVPFSDSLTSSIDAGADLTTAWAAAADVAVAAAAATADLMPKMGRARPHAEKSLGTPDAGATSLGLITRAVADVIAARADAHRAS